MKTSKKLENVAIVNKNHPRYLDLNGQRFGKLIILKSDLPNRKVLARCDCGTELQIAKSSITTGHSKSCGKGICRGVVKNLTGRQFGYLTVNKLLIGKSEHNYGTLWECICICGKIHNVVSHSLVTGQTKSCGCKSGELYSQSATKPDNEAIINSIWTSYQCHAKNLNVNFNLSKEQFKNLIFSPCHYCSSDLSNIRKVNNLTGNKVFKYNGIDRMNTNEDYTVENCVAACKNCNYAKRKLSYDDFINLAKKIAANFN
jgi:hypothetical protein